MFGRKTTTHTIHRGSHFDAIETETGHPDGTISGSTQHYEFRPLSTAAAALAARMQAKLDLKAKKISQAQYDALIEETDSVF